MTYTAHPDLGLSASSLLSSWSSSSSLHLGQTSFLLVPRIFRALQCLSSINQLLFCSPFPLVIPRKGTRRPVRENLSIISPWCLNFIVSPSTSLLLMRDVVHEPPLGLNPCGCSFRNCQGQQISLLTHFAQSLWKSRFRESHNTGHWDHSQEENYPWNEVYEKSKIDQNQRTSFSSYLKWDLLRYDWIGSSDY